MLMGYNTFSGAFGKNLERELGNNGEPAHRMESYIILKHVTGVLFVNYPEVAVYAVLLMMISRIHCEIICFGLLSLRDSGLLGNTAKAGTIVLKITDA